MYNIKDPPPSIPLSGFVNDPLSGGNSYFNRGAKENRRGEADKKKKEKGIKSEMRICVLLLRGWWIRRSNENKQLTTVVTGPAR